MGLYDYNARYYDANIGRFISADSIVPGIDGSTIGLNSNERLTTLTVDFHETPFIAQVNQETQQLVQFGPSFSWSQEQKEKYHVPMGPSAPQNLNRYTYALNNPSRFIDPSGHNSLDGGGNYWYQDLTTSEAWAFVLWMLGSGLNTGLVQEMYDFGEDLVIGGIIAAPVGGVLAGWPGLIVLLVSAGGEMTKEMSNTLKEIAEAVQTELENGAQTIRIELDDDLIGGATVLVIGNDIHAFSLGLFDRTDEFLRLWMTWNDFTSQAQFHRFWHIAAVTHDFNFSDFVIGF